MQGKIKFYDSEKHFGFIKVDDSEQEIFFHMSNVFYEPVTKGDAVKFDVENSTKQPGKKCCVNIDIIE